MTSAPLFLPFCPMPQAAKVDSRSLDIGSCSDFERDDDDLVTGLLFVFRRQGGQPRCVSLERTPASSTTRPVSGGNVSAACAAPAARTKAISAARCRARKAAPVVASEVDLRCLLRLFGDRERLAHFGGRIEDRRDPAARDRAQRRIILLYCFDVNPARDG